MKTVVIYSVRAQTAHGFVWKWRANDSGKKTSTMGFVSRDDCMADAKKNGYAIAPTAAG